jgi:hypothetical protein
MSVFTNHLTRDRVFGFLKMHHLIKLRQVSKGIQSVVSTYYFEDIIFCNKFRRRNDVIEAGRSGCLGEQHISVLAYYDDAETYYLYLKRDPYGLNNIISYHGLLNKFITSSTGDVKELTRRIFAGLRNIAESRDIPMRNYLRVVYVTRDILYKLRPHIDTNHIYDAHTYEIIITRVRSKYNLVGVDPSIHNDYYKFCQLYIDFVGILSEVRLNKFIKLAHISILCGVKAVEQMQLFLATLSPIIKSLVENTFHIFVTDTYTHYRIIINGIYGHGLEIPSGFRVAKEDCLKNDKYLALLKFMSAFDDEKKLAWWREYKLIGLVT